MLIYVHCACVEYHLISIYIVVHLFYIRVTVDIVCSGLILTSVLQPAGILQHPRTLSGWTEVHEVYDNAVW